MNTLSDPALLADLEPSVTFTDSHCHLNFPELREHLGTIKAAMNRAQVHRALCICTTLEEFAGVHEIAKGQDGFWASVGVHPDNEDVQEAHLEELLRLGRLPKVIAIGETGLDYYRLGERSVDDMEWQRQRFRVHIRAARQLGKPLVIHTRSASLDTLRLLQEEGEGQGAATHPEALLDVPRAGGVFHCFTETAEVARAALDIGYYISFSGILTFKNAQDLREVAALVPMDRLLIETDSPYLAPVPCRGKTNTPALVPWVAQEVARIKGLSVQEVARATNANFDTLFRPYDPARSL